MKFDQLTVILPCQTLEGYSLDGETDHADELLSAWSALYHPALLACAGKLPNWLPAQDPPKEPAGSLVMLPESSEKLLPAGWLEEATGAGACVIGGLAERAPMVEAALEQMDAALRWADPELAADFLALGFCHLQVEVLIRDAGHDMGYDAQYYDEQYYDYGYQFDRDRFAQQAVAAAEAALRGDESTMHDQLQSAFSQLTEARRGLPYTYSANQDPHLLDLTLVAPATLGSPLCEELARAVPTNLLISGEVLEQMARQEPATLAALKEALGRERAVIIGGEFDELPLPLMAPEAIFGRLGRGREAYQRHLGQAPTIFGRRRFGISPVLPQILRKCGFARALHFTLDEGRFPTGSRSSAWWVGMDGTEVEAVAQLPLDASQSRHFLNFASKVSNTSYQENNATVVLAHWPGQSSPWYRDLQRAAAYSPVLGDFRTIPKYLEESQPTSERIRSEPDDYRSPYLRQAVAGRQADPISRWVRYHRRRAAADAVQSLAAMADVVAGAACQTVEVEDLAGDLEAVEGAATSARVELDDRLREQAEAGGSRFSGLLPRQKGAPWKGYLVVNPWSFPRRAPVDVSKLARLPAVGGPIRAAGESARGKHVVVDAPAMGFAWVGPGPEDGRSAEKAGGKSKKKRRRTRAEAAMAEENVLRNDRFEVTIDASTGGIRAIHDYLSRGNRLAQQIALRLPRPAGSRHEGWDDLEQHYTVMAADKISVTSAGPVLGEIVSRGRLMTREGRQVARFVQTAQAWRGSPVLRVKIDLEIDREPEPDPWNSYYAARFAWGDAAADVYRSVSLASRPTEWPQIEAPHFVEMRSGQRRVTILTGGLPYHRRFGVRKMDTLLVVHGETARSFELGIGIDLTHPVPAALDFLAPHQVQAEAGSPPADPSGWLFHLDAKNVVATHWEPLVTDGRIAGLRVRLLETEGRRCEAGLRSFRPIESARKVSFQHEALRELPVQDDRATIEIGPHEWVQVETVFTR